jgi:hypothetical protein
MSRLHEPFACLILHGAAIFGGLKGAGAFFLRHPATPFFPQASLVARYVQHALPVNFWNIHGPNLNSCYAMEV